MEALILAIILTYAVKKAAESGHLHWQGSKAANRRSTRGESIPRRAASAGRHDIGYWAHQALSGFPKARHGFAQGWTAGRTAQAEGVVAREKARADHLEASAGLIEQVREHRRRQDEAMDRIRAARDGQRLPFDDRPPAGPQPARGRHDQPPPAGDSGGIPEGTSPPASPGDAKQPRATACAMCGGPLPPDHDGAVCPACRQRVREAKQTARQTATTKEGTQMASDVTYDSVIGKMAKDRAAAENIQAEQARAAQEASQTSEEMQALDLDPATLGAMADHLDAMQAAQKAQERVMETSEAVTATLQQQQGQLAEAHKDTPHAADKEFFAA